ncbi:CapA family protein [Haloechinothrix sp. LS1_15]|uniref:CapA family protein n=1 Tax=Haloechinothrix sp. LS1_15 TaxID=2652248 RepID=UPI002946796C|nr:CapA family protein [Haloechinothrix sp. LS1_15]MDV6014058.1 CapA family protein [Haloechinothrix sp. LS1_15]
MAGEPVRLFLCGDVMLGRGIDQILPYPGEAELRESYVRDAAHYVRAAERHAGPLPGHPGFAWPWGEALAEIDTRAPHVRVINLENAVTRARSFLPGKSVHYRMNPDNIPSLQAVRPDACVLANNHILDFGARGLRETLATLRGAGLPYAGAGTDAASARAAVTADLGALGRVVVAGYGAGCSGIPDSWAATAHRPGVNMLPDLSAATAASVVDGLAETSGPEDVVVASIHWGSNWGYEIPRAQVRFAHRLVDGGVDIVHGHSSHHPRGIEIYRGRLILYGCGDCVNDYEGIPGHDNYRDVLRLLYFADLEPRNGRLRHLRMVPLRSHRLRLRRATPEETRWLHRALSEASAAFRTRVQLDDDGTLSITG